ncbi:MAG: DUF4190 domain-containing protein [Candidatus Saccharibacteria bacterium]
MADFNAIFWVHHYVGEVAIALTALAILLSVFARISKQYSGRLLAFSLLLFAALDCGAIFEISKMGISYAPNWYFGFFFNSSAGYTIMESILIFFCRAAFFVGFGLSAYVYFYPTAKSTRFKRTSVAAPGWYPDPNDASKNRYWDGDAWQDAATSPTATAPTAYQQPYVQGVMPTPSTFAIVSLITAFFMPILAVIFGHLAKGEIRRSRGIKTGDGMATAGLILGYLGIGGIVLWIILIVNIAW